MDTTVVAPDGTRLSTRSTGEGSPLVLVHGTTGSKDTWAFVVPHLEAHHSVTVYDRRGRGDSEDGADGYGLEAEIDDLVAVIDSIPFPPHLVAHSFGAVCALEAARRVDLASITLYEPPVHLRDAGDVVARTRAHLDAGEAGPALETFLPLAGSPVEEVEFLQSMPMVWDSFVAVAAATLDRELAALMGFEWDPTRYADVTAPALVLGGELTDAPVYASIDELCRALPQARVHTFPGQRHIAMAADPEGFATTVRSFTTSI